MASIPNIPSDNKGIHLRGSSHAGKVFRLNSAGTLMQAPKLKFENWVRFNFNMSESVKPWVDAYLPEALGSPSVVASMVKSASYPDMSIETETLNQYNRKRVIQKKIEFEPITVVMHDVPSGHTLAFWELYYNYYFRDGRSENQSSDDARHRKIFGTDKTDPSLEYGIGTGTTDFPSPADGMMTDTTVTHDMFGLVNHESGNQLLRSIELFYSRGGTYSKVILINPKISKFKHDDMDYAAVSGTMELTFTIEYENVIYGNQPYALTSEDGSAENESDIGSRPDAYDMPYRKPVTRTRMPFAERSNLKDDVPVPTAAAAAAAKESKKAGIDFGDGALANVAEGLIDGVVSNAQGQLGRILGNIGSDLTSSLLTGIKTGNFSLKPNPLKSITNVVNVLGDNFKGRILQQGKIALGGVVDDIAASALKATISGAASVADAFSSSDDDAQAGTDNTDGQTKTEEDDNGYGGGI